MARDSRLMMQIKRSASRLCYLSRALVVSLSLLVIVSASAYAQESGLETEINIIYTLNGVLVKPEDALANLLTLRDLVRPQFSAEEDSTTSFGFIYNDTQGFDDALEVLLQSAGLELSRFWRMLAGLEAFPDYVQNYYSQLAAQALWGANGLDLSTIALVKKIPSDAIKECKRVVVVAHSQGNLYLNSAVADPAFLTDTERKSFGTVNVAVPDSRVQQNVKEFTTTEYTTVKLDVIITIIDALGRALLGLPQPLPSNTNDGYINPFARALNHSFTAAYLANDESRSKIVQDTLQTLRSLSVPPCLVIESAVCLENPSVNGFTVTIRGRASSQTIGARLFGNSNSILYLDLFSSGLITSCNGWTGIDKIDPDVIFCWRQLGDPVATSWSSINLAPVASESQTTEARAVLILPPYNDPNNFHYASVPLSCPGSYPQ